MSRFADGDGFESEEDEQAFYADLDAAYKQASSDLRGFLAYLDAMPRKRIIADRFIAPASGDMCAVASFCDYKGLPREQLLKAEAESRLQRMSEGAEDNGGFEGPTVAMGEKAGLPQLVAFNLAWKNDMSWDTIEDGVEHVPGVQGVYDPGYFGGSKLKEVPLGQGTHWIRQPYEKRLYRAMTPEERWLQLRNHVAERIDAGESQPTLFGGA